MRLKFIVLLFIPVWLSFQGLAQDTDPNASRYNNARELMDLKQYGLAMQAFKPLTRSYQGNTYQKISSFFYAVCAYNNKQNFVARDMFLQITNKYPTWEKSDEVYLWLTKIYLDEGDYAKLLQNATSIKNASIRSEADALRESYLKKSNYEELDSLLKKYPSDKLIAKNLADRIIVLPIAQQDRDLLENIVSVYNLDKAAYRIDEGLTSEKKDKYQVAVMLPFMYDELKYNTRHLSNQFVIELYEGLLVAGSDLRNSGINISLHLYDTQRDSIATLAILAQDEMKHMDLIIGPLYPGPVKVVSDFAFENRINMVNPLSSNSSIVGNNPYAFLFMPTNETMARNCAEYVADSIENKNVFIFHGTNSRDSVLAYSYKKEIEDRGFQVCHMDGFATEDAKQILDLLTNTVTIEFDASEFETLVEEDKVEGNLRITEKDFLVIKPDSIGHVFLASNNAALVANTITGLETRGDTVVLVGSERWLDERIVSIGGLDRLQSLLVAPTFTNKTNEKYEMLNTLFIQSFNAYPTRNFYIGYEVMMTMGKMLDASGNLFQFDPGINDFIPGEIFYGTLFGSENSNQVVPIVKFNDSILEMADPR